MKIVNWGKIIKHSCDRCGEDAEYWFKKRAFFMRFERTFCKKCLLEVLREQKIEKTKSIK